MRVLPFVLLAVITAIAPSCSTASPGGPLAAQGAVPASCYLLRGTASDAGASDAGASEPQTPVRCADDAECGAGARCDTALAPPSCVFLYCLPKQAPCAHAEECASGMQCHASACNPCDLCGNLCEVDFTSSTTHCGECDHAVLSGQICRDGQPTCPDDAPTLCGEKCVDTASDSANCGECGKAVPTGGSCVGGKGQCAKGKANCDGRCVNESSDDGNCGGCGKVCKGPSYCSEAICYAPETRETPDSCDHICALLGAGFGCIDALLTYGSYAFNSKSEPLACSAMPPEAPPSYHFGQIDCRCRYTPP